ncbi:MAG TPA: DUF4097 family beta strand repeat-containing protein [Actinomycetota bacterium]|nr:DUF4097 family beta strand repeat-containing protein [Actinomycetota bacterium]
MPVFATPGPIAVTVQVAMGRIEIAATDRTDTAVEVRPSNASKKGDVTAAEQARVEFADGRLVVRTSKGWGKYTFWGPKESVDVRIELPAGSHLTSELGTGTLKTTGVLGDVNATVGAGDIQMEDSGPVHLRTGFGDITAGSVGALQISTGSGQIHVGAVNGPGVIKNANGNCWVGTVTGDLRVVSANGRITVGEARETVTAKTANGDIEIGGAAHGAVVAETAAGSVEIGVLEGVAAWLDVHTSFGTVRNDLRAGGEPGAGEGSVDIKARTAYGDITIHRTPARSGTAAS